MLLNPGTGTKGECASVWSREGQIATIKQASMKSPHKHFLVGYLCECKLKADRDY